MVADGIDSVAPPVGEPEAGLHHPHDVIVYATGFDITASIGNVEVIGMDGQSLRARWEGQRGPEAYLGITVPLCPNLFFCMGPNTGLG
jgi:cation diffusion facilitator CzcD-associated flavoprotein CzcO